MSKTSVTLSNYCNLEKDNEILIIYGMNIPDTTGHQAAVQVPSSPYICFCITWKKQNKQNLSWNEEKAWVNFVFVEM